MTTLTTLAAALLPALLVAAGAGAHAQQLPRAPVTFNRDVAPILHQHCAPCHHAGGSAPFSLLTFADARQRARLLVSVVEDRLMPPWQPDGEAGPYVGERRLSPAQVTTLARWVADGLLEGATGDMPTVPSFPDGWQLGTPDVVVGMPEVFTVPADGPDVFRNFVLPIAGERRRLVRAIEFRPGNARVLHHARLLLDDSGDMRRLDDRDPGPGFGGMDAPGARFPDGHFLGWAPGTRPAVDDYAWPLEPGNDLVIQMHLKPTGREERVQASVGVYFTDTPPAMTPVMLRLGSKTIDIGPGDAAYDVVDRFELPADVTVLSLYPHAHYLAKSMRVDARVPGGRRVPLLSIPEWDFNWQDAYTLARPQSLPRGAVIEMRYRYDNSAANPRNPASPPVRVRFGPGTRDEMGELLVQVVPRTVAGYAPLRAAISRKTLLADVAGEEKRIADVPGDASTRNALGVAYVQLGRVAEAVVQFEAALRVDPELSMAHYNLGVIAMGQQRVPEAIARFEQALALRPDYIEARNNLGIVLEAAGRPAEAEVQYRAALGARPSHAAARNNLGRVLLARGAVFEAMEEFSAVLRGRPDSADAQYNLGRALMAQGRVVEAVQQWRGAVALRPDSLVFTLDLAWTLATNPAVRNAAEAVRLAEGANRTAPDRNPAVLDVLAAAHAADGRLDVAIRTAQLALQRALATGNTPLADAIRQRLASYQSGTARH